MQPPRSFEREPTLKLQAWRAFLETHRDLVPYLDADFRSASDLDLLSYDVMLHVSEGEGGRRMTDLAQAVVLSKSGLTAVVDRMEREGLIERRPDPDDRRATRIVLTKSGEKRFRAAQAHHHETLVDLFTSRLSDEEARVIVDVMTRLGDRIKERREASRSTQ